MPSETKPDQDESPERDEERQAATRPRGDDEPVADPAHPGSERHADEQRASRGPRYHGDAWRGADEEPERGPDPPAEEETAQGAFEANDAELSDPGTRGAVFGRGGHGLVERDEVRDAPSNRDRKLDRGS